MLCGVYGERGQPFQERHLPGSHHPWVRIVSAHRGIASTCVCLSDYGKIIRTRPENPHARALLQLMAGFCRAGFLFGLSFPQLARAGSVRSPVRVFTSAPGRRSAGSERGYLWRACLGGQAVESLRGCTSDTGSRCARRERNGLAGQASIRSPRRTAGAIIPAVM